MHDFTLSHAKRHTRARVVNYELAALSPAHLEEITAIRRAIEGEFRSVVQAGVSGRLFRTPNPRMTALALASLGIDVARWFRDAGQWSPEEVAGHHSRLALQMVGVTARRISRVRTASAHTDIIPIA